MRASAAVRQQITGSFQISGSCGDPIPDFWKMHGIHLRPDPVSPRTGMLPPDTGKGKGRPCDWLSEEVQMHIGSAILVIWLVIGGLAAGQRGEYKGPVDCSAGATAAMTILAGPLNYLGVNPHINCSVSS
jgi:hypothetical protein